MSVLAGFVQGGRKVSTGGYVPAGLVSTGGRGRVSTGMVHLGASVPTGLVQAGRKVFTGGYVTGTSVKPVVEAPLVGAFVWALAEKMHIMAMARIAAVVMFFAFLFFQ